jgi:CheY-like chemotaxis protein
MLQIGRGFDARTLIGRTRLSRLGAAMIAGLAILIVEDQALVALDLADAVERRGGHVVGPVASVAEALEISEAQPLGAAILDANLVDRDVTPLAIQLLAKGTPFVVFSGTGLPDDLAKRHPDLPLVMKPAPPETVLDALVGHLASAKG